MHFIKWLTDGEHEDMSHVSINKPIGFDTEQGHVEEEKEVQREKEYYCGLCKCMVPLSHFPHS